MQWLTQDEVDFDIYDLRLNRDLVLYESADIYYHNDQVLLPFYVVTGMLELNLNYGPKSGLITGKIEQSNVLFQLQQTPPSKNGVTDLSKSEKMSKSFAVLIDNELYLDTTTLAYLINANITMKTQDLAIEFVSQGQPFPIQKRLARSNNKVVQQSDLQDPTYDFLIEDQYRIYTPPKGHVSISARKNQLNDQLNLNVQTYNDLLYHASHLSMAQNTDNQLTARFSMRRSQTAPDKKILGSLNHYAFGDVSASNTRLQSGYSGLGVVFGSVQAKYSSYFGKINIEEDAPAGWQAELYKNGFLMETGTVAEDGRIIFSNIDTTYGINRFEIKLYGPYGEEQIIDREVIVGHNMLKPGEFNFNGGIIDTGSSLFNNQQFSEKSSSPAAFIQTEFGLNAKTSLGLSYFVQQNPDDSQLHEGIISLTRQLPNALADVNVFIQEHDKYKFDVNLLGNFGNNFRYSAGAFSNKNYDNRDATAPLGEQNGYRAGFTARLGAVGLGLNGYSKSNIFELDGVSGNSQFDDLNFVLSSRFKQFNITNTVNYSYNSALNSTAYITDKIAISSPIGDKWYLRTSANFNIENGEGQKTELDSIDLNATWRAPAHIYASFNGQYNVDNQYRVSTNVSVRKQKFNMVFGTSYSSETKWQVSAGLTFNIDYDYHNGQVNFQSEYSAASSTLDLMTYIDNNQNAHYDEYDEPLSGVQFGVKPYWRDIRSNTQGLTYLPGLGHNAPIKVHFNTMETKSPALKPVNDNFRFYTHAGGVTSLDIPFNYAVTLDGILEDKTYGQKAKFVPVQLVDKNSKVVAETLSDIEHYYMFEDQWPGQYELRIDPAFLASKKLYAYPKTIKLTLTGSDQVLTVDTITISDINRTQIDENYQGDIEPKNISASLTKTNQRTSKELQRGEFFSIQFGAYDDREYCHMRTTDLKRTGVDKAFYSMGTKYCTVMAGEFNLREDANQYLYQIPPNVRTDAYVRVFSTIRTVFAVLLETYTTEQECQSYILQSELVNTYVENDNQRCSVYLGDFLTEELAQDAYNALPYVYRKGAKVVEL
ncbi:hypothetical protein KO525_13485 [Psychrosphaera sp. B3R10]|uniref:hypothetical protein n=1 Tax=unclassified Psychrosphaera TaxID=2641570 RepID=UPI001C0A25E8|nr:MULTISPECIES: hypothetical protein [unclassified Psychrosphaera]MBU2882866.1 hypothetical protein [Psychrosphaera sp. I2R16]MBU2990395.1 hypothetical protein [Psychrosphaera sp. B3R10]